MKYLRIKKNTDFQKLFNKGKRSFSSSLTLLYSKSDKLRMGICVSKKHGGSVQRNRIKRLLRAAFFNEQDKVVPCSLILMPKVKEEYTYATFCKDLKTLLKKEKLYK